MTLNSTTRERAGCKWILILLFAGVVSLLSAKPAQAQSALNCVSDFGGILDGNVNPINPPSQLSIDGNCIIRNYGPSNPFTSNISFYGNNPTSWLVIFDNVVFTGNMSCDKSQGNAIWFTNGSISGIKPNCQNLFVPTEKIDKQNPAGQTTAAIGVPFTYKMTIPVLFDPQTGTVINSSGSPNDLHDITVTDDLNATGADMTLVSQRAYWVSNGSPIPYTFSNAGGVLTFSNFPTILAGQQFVIELTVVLNDTPGNTPGKQFANTAKWNFGRLINGIFYEPLPGVWGVTPPMTIAGSSLVMTKSGPATMSQGQWGNFALDLQNTGNSDAWNVSLRDLLPNGATGGMCTLTPDILSLQVFAADGVTPVAGKGPLIKGTDYTLNYAAAPNCQLDIVILTAAGTISPTQHLILRYRTQLDANTQNGVALTNVAGAMQWFNGDSSITTRKAYTGILTNGTPGVADSQDAHTVNVALNGYIFTKTVTDITSGANPATTAAPGDKLRYTLTFRTTNQALNNFSIVDDMDGLNPQADFAAGTLTLVASPAGSDTSNTNGTGGTKGTGIIDVRNINLPVNSQAVITFDITLKSPIANGTVVTNQATLRLANGTTFAWSDDPNVNGLAPDPTVPNAEDPTRVTIVATAQDPALVFTKSGPATMSLGQWGNFTLDILNNGPGDAWNVSLRDLLPTGATGGMCTLTPDILSLQVFAADGVTPVPGKNLLIRGTDYSFNYTGAPNCQLDIVILTAAGTISATQHLILRYRTQLDANTQNGVALTNVAGAIQWFNGDSSVPTRKTYTGPLTNGTVGVPDNQDAHTVNVTAAGYVFTKTVTDITSGANPATTAAPGDKLRYTLTFRTTNQALNNFSIVDDMDSLNAQADFAAGTLALVASPAGSDTTNTSSTGGTKGTGIIDVRNINLPVNSQAVITFDITLKSPIANGTVVTNQATVRLANGTTFAWSDDPNVNGTAPDPTIPNAEDPTRVTIVVAAADPTLVMTKLGPATMSLGQWGNFSLDIQNNGLADAWNVSLRDLLPTGATGGMCTLTPDILSLQVFAADGVTPVAGKGALTRGTDYSLSFSGAPNCQLDISILTAAGTISPTQHLILRYRTQLDANTQNGVALTNVAGAMQWFNADSSVPTRKTYTGILTNGTPGVLDSQDAHTVNAALAGYEFTKTVMDVTSGANPATTAAPGDKLRYTLTFRTTNQALNNFSIVDDMDALNAQADFAAGTLTLVASPAGSDTTNTSNTGGTKGTGIIDVRNISLPANSQAVITFDITLKSPIANGTVVTNQAIVRLANGTTFAWSDDPNVNGTAPDPTIPNAEDPTRVTIAVPPADPTLVLTKSGPATMNSGQWGNFTLDIQNNGLADAWNVSLRDLLPTGATGGMCTLTPDILSLQVFAADGVTPVAGKGPLTRGTDYSFNYAGAPNCQLDIVILTAAGTISPTQHLILSYRTQIDANTQNGVALTNVAGAIQWFNGDPSVTTRKTYTGPLTNGTPGVLDNQDAHTVTAIPSSDPILVLTKSGPATMIVGQWGNFSVDIQNNGINDAWNVSLRDLLPTGATGGMCNLTPDILSLQVFAADGVTPVAGKGALTRGTDYSFNYTAAPNCQLDISILTAAGTISPTQHLILRYRTQLDANTQNGVALTNVAGAVQWFNGDSSVTTRKTYTGVLTNGTPGVPDNQDAHTVTVAAAAPDPSLVFTKGGPTTMNLGQWGTFSLDLQNNGPGDAWNVSIRDLLPNSATGGMCNLTPEILSAQVFASDGVTPVAGKGPLNKGTDYLFNYSAAPNCQLDITILTAAGTISPTQRLILTYRTQFDTNTQNGISVTNIAGALQWFNGDSSTTTRKTYTGLLTNGTPGVPDNQDAHSVTAALTGYVFSKTVVDLTSGANPATTAAPGDKLRYSLLFRTTNQALSNFSIVDDMDSLNAQAVFVPGTLTLVTTPTGADTSATSSTGGTKGTGIIDVRNLNVPVNSQALIQFDITLKAPIVNGTVVTNQATVRLAVGTTFAWSDDPNVNGVADPTVPNGSEDPTRVSIVATVPDPALVFTKSGPATMSIGQWGNFSLDIVNNGPGDAWNVSLRDLLPTGATGGMCTLTPDILSLQVFAADGVTPVAGKGALTKGTDYSLTYTPAPNCQLDISILTAAGTISPTQHLILRYRTQLDANTQNGVALTNVAGAVQWFNADSSVATRKTYTGILTNGTPGVPDNQDAHTVNAALAGYVFTKTVADITSGANPATTAAPGDKLRYTLTFRATNQALNNFSIVDDMDGLNAQADFAAGTLTLVSSPAGADTSNTSSTGGTKGTGIIDVRNINLAVNSQAVIQFDITLKAPLANGTVVANQATVRLANGTTFAWSDDPNVNGTAADPTVPNAEDPTRVTITSSSVFKVQKISTYLRDPNVLLAGDTMRYTITVRNISNATALNVMLRDAVPANTAYVPGSTTLNGAPVADVAGQSPLVNGMLINSPADPTPGLMPVDPSNGPASLATITFNVVVNPTTPDGTIISNQGFLSATGIADQPSDDPRTPVPNDPTRDVVGNRPALYAEKKVALFTDLGSPGIVDPGDVLRYTITIKNSAAISATGVVLTDSVPANTTYVANTTLLNGSPIGQPDGGVAPLASGISIGTIAPGTTATLQYDLRVNLGTPAGTQIINQAVVTSAGQPSLLTDSDGNPANGAQPTVVVVGAGQQISITAQVSVVGGGPAVPGAQLDYVINVVNTAAVPAFNLVITDDLNGTQPGQLSYVTGFSTLNGSLAGVSFAGSTITANFSAINGPLAAGASATLKFRATLSPSLTNGTVVTDTGVAAWNTPTQTVSASVSIIVGSLPGLSVLNGAAWFDANFDTVQDSSERALAGWSVELYQNSQLSQSVQTDANGVYRITGVTPNDTTGVKYELRFHAPGAGPNTASLGRGASPFTNGPQRISDIIVQPGANLQGLNLPIRPNGVIYNSMARTPVAGAILNLLDGRSSSPLPASCFDDAAQQGQVTLTDGYYRFDINFSDPACPSGGDYLIGMTPPAGSTYVTGYSQIIPPTAGPSNPAFSVPSCPASPADVIPATTTYCEVQPSPFAPASSVSPRTAGTTYYVHLILDGSQIPGSSQIFNNSIPMDPVLMGAITVSKTTPLQNVTRGQLVPYTITANNHSGMMLAGVSIVDRLPAGFTYIKGSALVDGVPTEPTVVAGTLSWNGLSIAGTQVRTVKLLVAVGAGANRGEFINRAQALSGVGGNAMSGEATATVRLVPDPTFDCTDVFGKVYNDANRNGRQDEGEEGLANVRVVTPTGLQATTDQYGRYHITCAITPNDSRGSNFVLKLDDRTLPSGFRLSTDQVQIQRATSGKALQLNFGASIHRVVSIDLLDAAFEPGKTEIREQWKPRLNTLLDELRKAPAVLRLSYVADTEDAALVKQRMDEVKRHLTEAWGGAANSGYPLTIEPEVFWRRGAPPKQSELRVPKAGK
jgi:uncharacterized repeat protein (TIGR01451 family)